MRLQDIIPLSIRKQLGGAWERRREAARKEKLLHSLRGDAVECKICGWKGARFADDQWHPGTICPNCKSQVRHRMLTAIFDGVAGKDDLREEALILGKDVLHFAPERQLRDRIKAAARKYVTADFDRGDTDLRLDISAMPQVADASFDTIICCDVLEHVPDDAGAFREIFRVLRPGGIAILTVPQMDSPATTDEDSSVADAAERLRRFGQADHVRMYGDEFASRAEKAGLKVETVDREAFSEEAIKRLVLHPPVVSKLRLATNERRIYFCRR